MEKFSSEMRYISKILNRTYTCTYAPPNLPNNLRKTGFQTGKSNTFPPPQLTLSPSETHVFPEQTKRQQIPCLCTSVQTKSIPELECN